MVCVALSILFGMPTQEAFARESLKWLREYAFSKRTYLKIGRVWQYRQLPVWSLCSCSSCTPSSLNHIRKFVEVISSHTKQNTAALAVGTLQGPHKEGLGWAMLFDWCGSSQAMSSLWRRKPWSNFLLAVSSGARHYIWELPFLSADSSMSKIKGC